MVRAIREKYLTVRHVKEELRRTKFIRGTHMRHILICDVVHRLHEQRFGLFDEFFL